MINIINRLRFFLIFISSIISFYSLSFYEGSKIIFTIYNFILIILFLYLTNFKSSFFSFFIAIYLFMGFWFKYNLSLIFNDGYVFDSGSLKSNDIDSVLLLSIYIFITIIISFFVSRRFNYSKFNTKRKLNFISLKYFKFKYIILFLFLLLILLIGYFNFFFKIYVKGFIFDNNYNYFFENTVKWFLLFGLSVCSCYLLNQEARKKNPYLIIFIVIIFFELFISYTSMLSRAILLFGIPFVYSFIFYQHRSDKLTKNFVVMIAIYFLFTISSIYISNNLRLSEINSLKKELKVQFKIKDYNLNYDNKENVTKNEIRKYKKNFENSRKFDFQINEVITEKNTSEKINAMKVTSFILINRWVGIDSLINVSQSNNLSFKLFLESLKEKKSKTGNSFYETNFDLENKKPSFYSGNIYVKGNTLPGLITFFYYSGSLSFLLFSIFIIFSFFSFLEKKIFIICNGNLFFVAFFSHYIANRIFSFGYAPRDTYLFIISLFLSVIFIYFLETNRFDKILSNLK